MKKWEGRKHTTHKWGNWDILNIDGLAQDCGNSSACVMQLQ